MGYITSGNAAVDSMGKINISGNVIPQMWYRTVIKDNGKPHLLAVTVLADIVYWYRPSEVRDEGTGQVTGWKNASKVTCSRKHTSSIQICLVSPKGA